MVAGLLLPESGGRILRIVPGTPWTGPVCRRESDEGEQLAVHEALAQYLLGRYGDVTLTLRPETIDVRGFIWSGMRTQVRYTYRGRSPRYEKRLRLRSIEPTFEEIAAGPERWWQVYRLVYGDTTVEIINQPGCVYYWQANRGGSHHAEMVDAAWNVAYNTSSEIDLVGCNSPSRALFKRSFGLPLVPYYCVTTADPKEIAEFWPLQEAKVA